MDKHGNQRCFPSGASGAQRRGLPSIKESLRCTCHHFATVLTHLLGSDTAVRLTVSGSMPLSVEHIGKSADGHRVVSLCHYREQTRQPDARSRTGL